MVVIAVVLVVEVVVLEVVVVVGGTRRACTQESTIALSAATWAVKPTAEASFCASDRVLAPLIRAGRTCAPRVVARRPSASLNPPAADARTRSDRASEHTAFELRGLVLLASAGAAVVATSTDSAATTIAPTVAARVVSLLRVMLMDVSPRDNLDLDEGA